MPNEVRDLVVISCCREDFGWLEHLRRMFKPYAKAKNLSYWDPTLIPAGGRWREETAAALARAKVAVLLVSMHYLADDDIQELHFGPLLEAARRKALVLLWACVSACGYKTTDLGGYEPAHDVSRPLESLNAAELREALRDICEEILLAAVPLPPANPRPELPPEGPPLLRVEEGRRFLVRDADDTLREVPWDLAELAGPFGRNAPAQARDWKRVHTLAEQLYPVYLHLHQLMTWCTHLVPGPRMPEADSQARWQEVEKHRAEAQSHLHQSRRQIERFARELQQLPLAGTDLIRHLSLIPLCSAPLMRSLSYLPDTEPFRDGLRLTERIGGWLLDGLHTADQVLELYFLQ